MDAVWSSKLLIYMATLPRCSITALFTIFPAELTKQVVCKKKMKSSDVLQRKRAYFNIQNVSNQSIMIHKVHLRGTRRRALYYHVRMMTSAYHQDLLKTSKFSQMNSNLLQKRWNTYNLEGANSVEKKPIIHRISVEAEKEDGRT